MNVSDPSSRPAPGTAPSTSPASSPAPASSAGDLSRLAHAVLLPGFVGTGAPDWVRRRIGAGLGGVVLFGRNVVDDDQVAALTAALRAERPDLVVGIDEEGGDVTRLDALRGSLVPGNHALGAVNDVALTEEVAGALGARLAACGVTLDLAPCADLTLTPDDPVIGVRAFGSDPHAVARQVAAFVTGLQSAGVAACVKHFPGHGAAAADSHHELPTLNRTEAELRAAELVPFQTAVAAGARSVMTGHLVVPAWGDAPATLNRRAIGELLRTELGFTGAVVTDALEMGAVAGRLGDLDGLTSAAVRALLAGADGLCLGGELADEAVVAGVVDALVAAVRAGLLPEERLAEAAARVAELGGTPRTGPADLDALTELGLRAARRAVVVRGELALRAAPLVVDVVVPGSIAVGDVPWGVGPHLAELAPGTAELRVGPEVHPDEIRATAAGRPVVVVTREAHRHPGTRDLLTRLAKIGLDLVHVETGVPGPDQGTADHRPTRVDTHGGSLVSLRAAAELLAASIAAPGGQG
ncbi:glycoside hydrolase family 3 N-terminal domain-containing protein [Streptoalloteichus hindustanus]|uniref:Beta-N-acetylhexosaminidase n=1 Tax=Streptoalloteichus hindustanus TaxID=2017 RepID=A0A1M4W6U5_STRHI|nr:glycoside hydrolase family 3 N-terminal domain-containing protein [Streptoalloteichus hindustanus]SHE76870.1 beta-N-acetylhexosaminidase [Streptoalloteichus hindustanus]